MNKIIMILTAAALPLAAFAEDYATQPQQSKMQKRGEDMSIFSQMDPATRMQLLKQFDKNGDGRLDKKERALAMKSVSEKSVNFEKMRSQHAENVIKKFDTDGDGKLDSKEVANFLEEQRKMLDNRREHMMRRNQMRVSADILSKYDKDGDGKLSNDERKAMHEDMRAKRKALFDKYDADKDGKLNDSEKEQLINDPEIRNMMKRMLDRVPNDGGRRQNGQNENPSRR